MSPHTLIVVELLLALAGAVGVTFIVFFYQENRHAARTKDGGVRD